MDAIASELARFDSLLEAGVGRRPDVARALADRGRTVIAIDLDEDVLDGTTETGDVLDETTGTGEGPSRTCDGSSRVGAGSCRVCHGDVIALADADDPLAALPVNDEHHDIDAVYALNLPAELQRPTVELAERLHAACVFTTLGFEEPIVPVRRRSISGETLYVAREEDRRRPRQ